MTRQMKKEKLKARLKLADQRQKWLRDKKLTIRQFAKLTKNDYGTVYLWLREGRDLRLKYLDALLDVFPTFPY